MHTSSEASQGITYSHNNWHGSGTFISGAGDVKEVPLLSRAIWTAATIGIGDLTFADFELTSASPVIEAAKPLTASVPEVDLGLDYLLHTRDASIPDMGALEFHKPASAIKAHKADNSPLWNVCPNPSSSFTAISYTLTRQSHTRIDVYGATGCRIETLIDATQTAGQYEFRWNATGYAPGLYIIKVTVGSSVSSKQLVLK
jgi:hypothetical protein